MLINCYPAFALPLLAMKNDLPTYAIVELLIRLSHINPLIGDYKGHALFDDGVIVKTTHGNITFSKL